MSQQPTPGHESAPPDPVTTGPGGPPGTGATAAGGNGRPEPGGPGWATAGTPFGNGSTSGDDLSGSTSNTDQYGSGSSGADAAAAAGGFRVPGSGVPQAAEEPGTGSVPAGGGFGSGGASRSDAAPGTGSVPAAGGFGSGAGPGTPAGAPVGSTYGGGAGYGGGTSTGHSGGTGYAASAGQGAPGASGGYGGQGTSAGQSGATGYGASAGQGAPGASGGYGGPAGGSADSEHARAALNRLRAEVGKVVVGQDPAVTGLVIALLCRGHVLLEGVPGVAKTLMVRALSASLELETKRLQFTPDLMPGDVTGSLIYDARTAEFSFRPGPVFTNLLLADEINRTPPKTQASLLEAMEERQVSVEGEPRMLPDPFIVVATQNPIEYEGTYPLPEAQLDRFLLKLTVPLPSRDEEFRVLNNHHRGFDPRDLRAAGVTKVADAADLAAGRAAVRGVQAAAEVLAYVVDLCRATRQSPSLSLGASPRGATALLSTAKAWAWLSGRDFVTPDDVKALARPTLRHRVAVRPEAELEGVTADGVLDSVLASVPAPR